MNNELGVDKLNSPQISEDSAKTPEHEGSDGGPGLLAVGAGLCAACASLCAKLAMESSVVADLCRAGMFLLKSSVVTDPPVDIQHTTDSVIDVCASAALFLRIVCFSLIFAFNAVMWILFVKSLQRSSSLAATVTNTASNFFFTAVSSWVVFGESLPPMWWCGAVLVVLGLLLIHRSSLSANGTSDEKQKVH